MHEVFSSLPLLFLLSYCDILELNKICLLRGVELVALNFTYFINQNLLSEILYNSMAFKIKTFQISTRGWILRVGGR